MFQFPAECNFEFQTLSVGRSFGDYCPVVLLGSVYASVVRVMNTTLCGSLLGLTVN